MATPSKKARPPTTQTAALRRKPRPRPLAKGEDDLVALVNAEGIVTYISPAIVSLLGYPPEALVGAHLSTLAHPADSAAIQQMVEDVGRAPNKHLSAAYRLRAKDGSARLVEGSATNLLQVPGVSAIITHFHETSHRKLAPRANWRKAQTAEHFVQFYENDAFLLDVLSSFVETGLHSGDTCMVIATQSHREALEAQLQANGLNLAAAQTQGTYVALDTSETLAQFMVDGMPEPARFYAVVAPFLTRAATGQRRVRIFGEMVALLCAAGNQMAAIRLEELWNDRARITAPISLFCAYAMSNLAGQENEEAFNIISHQHARVIPAESYSALPRLDERLRTISALQQKATSLQAEIAERKAAEQRTFEALTALLSLARSLAWTQQEAEPPTMRVFAPQLAELARGALGCEGAALILCDAETAALETLAIAGTPTNQSQQWQALLESARLGRALSPETIDILRAGASVLVDISPAAPNAPLLARARCLVAPMQIAERLIGFLAYACSAEAQTFTLQQRHLAEAVAQLAAFVLEREHWVAERSATQAQLLALEETTRQMEAFVSIVSHELRTPITALKTSIQLAQRRIAQEPISSGLDAGHIASPAALLKRTEAQVRRLTRLIDDLVDLARIRSGKIEIRETLCDLGQVVQELVESERLVHPNRLIHFEKPNEPLLVNGDPDRLGQVALNYLTNALKYAPPTSPITVRVQQRGEQGEQVQVRVEDHGPGIPAEEQERIWEIFHRAPGIAVQSGSGIGLGLGLHISKMMIERQGGQVGVESAAGQGSAFWFTLPLAAD